VANANVYFRRCFGEVFRSRSFLFLGSSLSEEYFLNLFGETLELCGPSPVPHFAFLPKKLKIDSRFLAEQMNITVCQYKDHEELPELLAILNDRIRHPMSRISRWSVEVNDGLCLEIAPHSPLPIPEAHSNWAVAVVVEACPEGRFVIDRNRPELRSQFRETRFEEGEHVVSPKPGIFAVRARTGDSSESDSVGAAVRELLRKIGRGREVLHLHLPSAGGTVPPVYGFIEAVRAFGDRKRESGRPLRLIAYVGSQVMLNLTSHQICVHELLTSTLIRFWTVVNAGEPMVHLNNHVAYQDTGAEPARRVLYKEPRTTLREVLVDVLGELDDAALKHWRVSVCPSPRHDGRTYANMRANQLEQSADINAPLPDTGAATAHSQREPVTADSVASKTLRDIGIVFGSVLTLDRASQLWVCKPEKYSTATT
jgi:hypothetical protein